MKVNVLMLKPEKSELIIFKSKHQLKINDKIHVHVARSVKNWSLYTDWTGTTLSCMMFDVYNTSLELIAWAFGQVAVQGHGLCI